MTFQTKEDREEHELSKDGFIGFGKSIQTERVKRLVKVQDSVPYGIDFLDDTFRTIDRDDLILIGAYSGAGKTELVSEIGMKATIEGRRVGFFPLEAAEGEIEARIKFKAVSSAWAEHGGKTILDYHSWVDGVYDQLLDTIERKIDQKLGMYNGLQLFYRHKKFTIHDFRKIFNKHAEKFDLIIVDHLHYFDIDGDNENRAYKQMMMEIRDLVLVHNVPVILVAHLRKKASPRGNPLLPTLDDFHGSSDIAKICTKAFVMAGGQALGANRYATYGQVVKCRKNGSLGKYVGQMVWNTKYNQFEEGYKLGKLSKDQSAFVPYIEGMDDEYIPNWATRRHANNKDINNAS